MNNHSKQKSWYQSAWAISLLGILLALVMMRVSAPYAIKAFANNTLEQTQGISGEIGDIDLHLYRGAYEIENIKIYQGKKFSREDIFANQCPENCVIRGIYFRVL